MVATLSIDKGVINTAANEYLEGGEPENSLFIEKFLKFWSAQSYFEDRKRPQFSWEQGLA